MFLLVVDNILKRIVKDAGKLADSDLKVIEPRNIRAAIEEHNELKVIFGQILFFGAYEIKKSWAWEFCFGKRDLQAGVKEMLHTISCNFVNIVINNTIPFLFAHQVSEVYMLY